MNITPGTRFSNRHYRLHRLALSPVIAENPSQAFTAVKNSIRENEEKPFLLFIMQNGLGPLWHDLLRRNKDQTLFSQKFTRELRNITSFAASLYLFQKIALDKIEHTFTANSIQYTVFKGAHTREVLYDQPELRYACDIDILVSRADRVQAIKALMNTGYSFNPDPKNISHEATLTDDRISIDLHWDILRPGRTRRDMTGEFLDTGRNLSGYRVLSNEATLFILLVHPVFTKYATAPQSSLLHLLELHYWIRKQETDWDRVLDYLDQGGVKTAAWITATWLEMLTGESLPEPWMKKIKPSTLKAWYLRKWLEKNLSTRLLDYPFFIQAGFTIAAHDSLCNVFRTVKTLRQEMKNPESIIAAILEDLK